MLANRYEIRQILGEGATSTVYLGHDHVEDAAVAIKSQPCGKTREHEIHAGLQYEHVVRLKNFISGERRAYLIFECCDFNLISFINAHDIDMRAALKIMRMVLLGIKHLHDKGIIHRDIKLGNILIKGDTVKICDLGLACYARERDFSYCGTKDYLAPEIMECWSEGRASGAGYDGKVDIYAAGVVFKILLSRRKDVSVDEMDSVGEGVRGFLKSLLDENPERRLSADMALKDPVFRPLIGEVPDFRMVRPFCKASKYGELRREGNFVQIRWARDGQPAPRELRIEYRKSGCSCLTAFCPAVYMDGRAVSKEYLTDSELKYFNYVVGYLKILCGRTPRLCIADRGATFTRFVDGSYLYEKDGLKISRAANGSCYVVNGVQEAGLPGACGRDVQHLERACAERCRSCVCVEERLAEPGSTVTLTIGDRPVARESAFILGLGWCIRDHLRFQFLLSDGARFFISAQRRTITVADRVYEIDRELPEECKQRLRSARRLLQEFVK